MTPKVYQELASRTECDQLRALDRMCRFRLSNNSVDPTTVRLNHAVLGMVGEVGELAGAVEKHVYYGQDLDRTNLLEEVGDVLWYVALLCNAMQFDLEKVMERNIEKLRKRYPVKYEDQLAAEHGRDRDAERKVLEDTLGEDA